METDHSTNYSTTSADLFYLNDDISSITTSIREEATITSTNHLNSKSKGDNRCNLKRLLCPLLRRRNRTSSNKEGKVLPTNDETSKDEEENRLKFSSKSDNFKMNPRQSKSVSTLTPNCCLEANLPSPETWPYRPIFIQPAKDTTIFNQQYLQTSIPIGIPIDFETSLFKGRFLIRIKNDFNIDEASKSYFDNRKRMRQYVVQGQFKEEIKMSDVYVGDFYQKPLGVVPPPFIDKIMKASFQRLAPGLIMDLRSDKPKVAALMAGTIQIMSIDKVGDEPDMFDFDMKENCGTMNHLDCKPPNTKPTQEGFQSISHRQKVLTKPTHAERFSFHPGQVYTFNHFDDVFDLGNYNIKIPLMKSMDLVKILNAQPTTIRACTLDGRSVFNFNVFHEKLYHCSEC